MMRNKSAQPSVRTPASPLCRSMMRPKVFHGTNSITCANNVLPTFMRDSGSLNPESIANPRNQIQIVDTLKLLETILMKGLAGRIYKINRTVVICSDDSERIPHQCSERDPQCSEGVFNILRNGQLGRGRTGEERAGARCAWRDRRKLPQRHRGRS